jgi:hypothetical protein
MKKATLLLALCAFAFTSASAQTTPKTEVNVRDNGTVKATTTNPDGSKVTTKSGRTNTGEAIHGAKEGTERVAGKTGHAMKSGAKKAGHGIKKGAHAVKAKAKDVAD